MFDRGSRLQRSRLRDQGLGFRVFGSGFRVEGQICRVYGT